MIPNLGASSVSEMVVAYLKNSGRVKGSEFINLISSVDFMLE